MTASATATAPSIGEQLRQRASVLSCFEVDWLALDCDVPGAEDEIDDFLLVDARRATDPVDGARRWSVTDDVRRSAAAQGFEVLHAAWMAVGQRPEGVVQAVIDEVIGHGRTLDLDLPDRDRLQAAALVSRWFGPLGDRLPSHAELDRRLRFEAMLDPLRALVADDFRDRVEELAELAEAAESRQAIVVVGRGGIGKSALLARHLLAMVDESHLVAYLNFDHSALDPLVPASMVAALTTQLSWQVTGPFGHRLATAANKAETLTKRADSLSATSSRTLSVTSLEWQEVVRELVAAAPDEASRPRVVVAVDTVEEARRRDWDLHLLTQLLDTLQAAGCSIVASGRADVPWFGGRRLQLGGLPRPDAVDLLRSLVADGDRAPLSRAEAEHIVDIVDSSPLCIRLAAGIVRSTAGRDTPFLDLEVHGGAMEGELYRRLLGHIPDRDVRKIAYPGLVLRRITPGVIQHVLARPCGVDVPTPDRARELFDGLAAEAMLVERDPASGALLHRSDMRPLMLERLAVDDTRIVAAIHRAAVRWYSNHDDRQSRLEELYHRLMLGQSARTLDRRWDDHVLPELRGAVDEMPPVARAYLLDKDPTIESIFSDDDLAELDAVRLRPVLERRVERLVAAGDLPAAADLLEQAPAPGGRSLLPVLELQVHELRGDIARAAHIAESEQRRRSTAGDTAGVIEMALHRARLWERTDELATADDHLRSAADTIARLAPGKVDDLLQLRLVCARLRLDRLQSERMITPRGARDELVDQAIVLFDAVPRRDLARHPELLRDLVGELGRDAPVRVLNAALKSAALEDRDGSISARLAAFDVKVSLARGRESGVLADLANVTTTDNDAPDWSAWVESEGSSTVASEVSSFIDEFDDELSDDFRKSIAEDYREASDSAHHYESE